jgi:hypothetical protein
VGSVVNGARLTSGTVYQFRETRFFINDIKVQVEIGILSPIV